jgi:PAT family beta-lactamase induction signal transducer AmpG
MSPEGKRAHPLLWVPSLYFAMGTPMIAVSVMAAIMYKNLGLSNTDIATYTGAMYLPWVIKPLWAPLVELFRTKKTFVLAMEATMVVAFSLLAFALRLPAYLPLSVAFFWIIGFSSATQDIAGDGVYLTSSTTREQALYIGIQGAAWNLGRVLVSGSLVSLTKILFDWAAAGKPAPAAGPHPAWFTAWMIVMLLIAAIMGAAALWHFYVLPPGAKVPDAARTVAEALHTTGDAWASFFKKPRIWMMITAVFFYRFAEGFIEKIGPLFLLDKRRRRRPRAGQHGPRPHQCHWHHRVRGRNLAGWRAGSQIHASPRVRRAGLRAQRPAHHLFLSKPRHAHEPDLDRVAWCSSRNSATASAPSG